MSYDNTQSIETLRLQTPEEVGRQRVYEFGEAIVLLEHSLNAMGLSLQTIPPSPEVNSYEQAQNHPVVAEAEQLAKSAVAGEVKGLMESRAREVAMNTSQAGLEYPMKWLENTNA